MHPIFDVTTHIPNNTIIMTKYLFGCLLLLCGGNVFASAIPSELIFTVDQERYIKRYKEIAIREMERSGVPASIKLAQGILESDSGKSSLARAANNHFGIKCGSGWQGEEYYKKDDDYDENGQLIKSCFRQYRNPDASYVAHSEFLRDPAKSFRYGFLFRLEPTDYKAWAKGLRQAGYATNPRYPELLISIIERYNLNQYDTPGAVDPVDVEVPTNEMITGILRANDVSYFVSEAPISVAEVAKQVDLSARRLLEYNEGLSKDDQQVTPGDRVYLQKKRNSYRGKEVYHTVEAGETLYDIAQRYGLKLDKLAIRNRLQENDNPATGVKVKLRGSKIKDAPRLEGTPDPDAIINDIPTDTDGRIIIDEPTDEPNTGTIPTTTPTGNRPVVVPRPTTPDPTTGNPTTNPPSSPYPQGSGYPPTTTTPSTGTGTTVNPPVVQPPVNVPPTNPTTPQPEYHTVSAGETLYAISRKYGLTVDRLKQINQLTNNNISIGQLLKVK